MAEEPGWKELYRDKISVLFGREGTDPQITCFVAGCSPFSFCLTGCDQLPRSLDLPGVGLALLGLERHGIKLE